MIKVYSHENTISVNHIKNILANNGISSFIKNENMESYGIGVGTINWPEVWLHDEELEAKAKELINKYTHTEANPEQTWQCSHCTEINEAQFGACWQCSESRDV